MTRNLRSGHSTKKWLGFLIVTSLAAASCGGNKGASDDTTATTSGASTSAVEQVITTLASTTAAKPVGPKRGGSITIGQEAENATGWSPQFSQAPISGNMPMRALYDSLTYVDEQGVAHPFLAESVKPDAAFTTWTVKARAGIKFHDGTAFDAAAIKANIEGGRCSPLLATAMGEFGGCPATFKADQPEDPKTNRKPLSTIYKLITVDAADPMTVKIELALPYPTLDQSMATVLGYMASPKMVADPTNGPKNPVGTGPFKFKSWTVNDKLELVKNPDYWMKAPDGQPYPYLDAITFKPVDDIAARENGLRGGTFDMIMTANGDAIAKFRAEKDNWSIFENTVGGETGHFLMNVFPTYKGKENPIADIRVRRALAKAINYDELNKLRNAAVAPVANGPFPPGTDGYLADSGFPKFDLAGAKTLMDEYKKEKGITGALDLDFGTTADPFNKGTNELVATYWNKIGVNAKIDQTEQGQYITRALVGDFQIFGWRNHGSMEADRGFVWWHSAMATDPPGIAINFGRIKDPEMDKLLVTIRTNGDKKARDDAAKGINKLFGDKVYNIWTAWTVWQFVANKKVQDIATAWTGPDGTKPSNTISRAMHWFQQINLK